MSERAYSVVEFQDPFVLIRRRRGREVRYRVVGFDGRRLYPPRIEEDHPGRLGVLLGNSESDRGRAVEAVANSRWLRLGVAQKFFRELVAEAELFHASMVIFNTSQKQGD